MAQPIKCNDITKMFIQIRNIVFFCGLPNIWVEDVKYSKGLVKFVKVWRMLSNLVFCVLMGLEITAFFTQKNMSEKQKEYSLMFSTSQPVLFSYVVAVEFYVDDIKILLRELVVVLKRVHNDAEIQTQMIRRAKVFTAGLTGMLMLALLSYGIEALMLVITGEGTFTTIITCWPDVEDKSTAANLGRVMIYITWWIFTLRIAGVYVIIIPTTICLSHQYKNLQSYFYSLNNIFRQNISEEEKDIKYAECFKIGIMMHCRTLWCTKKFQTFCGPIFSGQILINVSVIVMLMVQMMTMDRTPINVAIIVTTGSTVLFGTGLIMCNAGDITVESAGLPTAMYSSGWHKCRNITAMRRIIVVSIAQAQKPVVIWALGIVPLSYQSYVSIVKSSYSVFSVIY